MLKSVVKSKITIKFRNMAAKEALYVLPVEFVSLPKLTFVSIKRAML